MNSPRDPGIEEGTSMAIHEGTVEAREYFVYILTNKSGRTLYVGLTNDLERRLYEHRKRLILGFTARYNVDQLLYYEPFKYVNDAIAREKEIKGWRRAKKLELIRTFNPEFRNLTTMVLNEEEWATYSPGYGN